MNAPRLTSRTLRNLGLRGGRSPWAGASCLELGAAIAKKRKAEILSPLDSPSEVAITLAVLGKFPRTAGRLAKARAAKEGPRLRSEGAPGSLCRTALRAARKGAGRALLRPSEVAIRKLVLGAPPLSAGHLAKKAWWGEERPGRDEGLGSTH